MIKNNFLDKDVVLTSLKESFFKLSPLKQYKNPIMFIVFIGALITTVITVTDFTGFHLQISIWLWFTVLFANFSEALAEGRGKAQAESLRKLRTDTYARLIDGKSEKKVLATELNINDTVICETGDIIPMDGEVIDGIASVDESAITGESAPVVRESGGDRSAVTAGTKVISDRIIIRITSKQGDTFLDKMIGLVEGSKRQKTPNETALTILLSGMTIIFFLVVITLKPFELYALQSSDNAGSQITLPILIALLVCLIPTTIGGLLNAIGISGIDRLTKKNVIAKSGKAVEAAGDVDVLLLDKTGTITYGNRSASEFIPDSEIDVNDLAKAAFLSSMSDKTPEGRSIVKLAQEEYNIREDEIGNSLMNFVPFSAQTKLSGIDIQNENGTVMIRKGASESIRKIVVEGGGTFSKEIEDIVEKIAKEGSTPLVVCEGNKVLGAIRLKDIVKKDIKARFEQLRKMGIKTVMITGDNPLTAITIAAEAGVDDFIAEATPEDKLKRIRAEQAEGRLVAMVGDGTNDAPALAQADVGVAMNSGTQAAREAGNMVDLDSNPTKLIEVVEIGKQLLMTRGALTTFSIANDVAKYFAILPAIFASLYLVNGTGALASLNIMGLESPESAILSSVIFNALIIIALVPLALRGVKYTPKSASSILRRNVLVYGIGGLTAPFIGIKLIDLFINFLKII